MKSLNSVVVALELSAFRAQLGVLEVAVDDQKLQLLLEHRTRIVGHGVFHGDGCTLVIPRGVVDAGVLKGLALQLQPQVVHHGLAAVAECARGVAVHEELKLVDGAPGVGLVQTGVWRQVVGAQRCSEHALLDARVVGEGFGKRLEVVAA